MPEMTVPDFKERWGDLLDAEWMARLDTTPFLEGCRRGSVSPARLETFVAQQYFYARHFTRYLCALLSNIPDDSDRMELTENLVDETGLGVEKRVPHSLLYRAMLERLGVDISLHAPFPETTALIETMMESCRSTNPAVGLGALCLGAEAIVPRLYSQIVHGFEAQGVPREWLDFFYIHIGCDDAHAVTMKEIIARELKSAAQKRALRCSALRAIAARARFFEAIQPAVEERRMHA